MSALLDIQALTAAAIKPDDFEPLVRKLADDLYGKLLADVQDYMVENTHFNIGSTITQLKFENSQMRWKHVHMLDALTLIVCNPPLGSNGRPGAQEIAREALAKIGAQL